MNIADVIKPTTIYEESLVYALNKILEWEYSDAVEEIYLFGSCARNDVNINSDVDLYVVLNDKIEIDKREILKLKADCIPEDIHLPEVDVKFDFGLDAIMQEDLFHKNVRKDGVLIWQR